MLIKHKRTFVFVALFVVAFPIVANKIILSPKASDFLKNTLEIDLESNIGIIIDYLAILLNLILGVVVFKQTERINKLQIIQNEIFLQVVDLDYKFSYEDEWLIVDKKNEEYALAHIFTPDKKALEVHINIGEGEGRTLFLPIRLITTNQQKIVSLTLTSVYILAKEEAKKICDNEYSVDGNTIGTVLENGSQFVFGLGMVVPKESNINELVLAFTLVLGKQDKSEQKLKMNITLLRALDDTEFTIASSQLDHLN